MLSRLVITVLNLDNWSSYHNSVQAEEILPDLLFTTVQSPLTMLPASQGRGCSPPPAAQISLDPVKDPGQSSGQKAWG